MTPDWWEWLAHWLATRHPFAGTALLLWLIVVLVVCYKPTEEA